MFLLYVESFDAIILELFLRKKEYQKLDKESPPVCTNAYVVERLMPFRTGKDSDGAAVGLGQ